MSDAHANARAGGVCPTIRPAPMIVLLLAVALAFAFVRPGFAGEAGDFLPKAAQKSITVGDKTIQIPVPPRATHMDPRGEQFMQGMRLEAVYANRHGKQFVLSMAGTSPDLENGTFDAEMLAELIAIIKTGLEEVGVQSEILLEEPKVVVMKTASIGEENGEKAFNENAEAFMVLSEKFVYLRIAANAESPQSLSDTTALLRQWAADVFKTNGEAVPANLEP